MNPNYLYLKNNRIDTLKSAKCVILFESIVCDMMEDNLDFIKANGRTEKATIHNDRLQKLLLIGGTVSQVASENESLKLINADLWQQLCRIKQELAQLKEEINIANSI